MRSLSDDDDDEVKPSGPAKGKSIEQPAWMRQLLERAKEWLAGVPEVRLRFLTLLSCPLHLFSDICTNITPQTS